MKKTAVDGYVFDVLIRDLVGHDRSTSALLVYLHLWRESRGRIGGAVRTSHRQVAESVGLSKSAVQEGVRHLLRRGLLRVHKDSATAVPEYRVLRPWRRHEGRAKRAGPATKKAPAEQDGKKAVAGSGTAEATTDPDPPAGK